MTTDGRVAVTSVRVDARNLSLHVGAEERILAVMQQPVDLPADASSTGAPCFAVGHGL